MVIKDPWDRDLNQKKELLADESQAVKPPTSYPATSTDRAAALIIDLALILTPVLLLFVAPIRQKITYATITENTIGVVFYATLLVLLTVAMTLSYQFFSTFIFGATIGKRFFALRLVDTWTLKKPSAWQILIRSALWVGQWFFLGLPFLTLLLNDKRRAIHDQVSDTFLVCDEPKVAGSGMLWLEKCLAQIAIGTIAVLIVVFAGVQMMQLYMGSKGKGSYVSFFEENGKLCEVVSETLEELDREGYHESRLSVTLGLFSAQIVDEDCMKKEVNHYFNHGGAGAVGYLAKSFLFSESASISDRYLAEVCRVDSESDHCKVSEIVNSWNENSWQQVRQRFLQDWVYKNIYSSILAMRHFFKRGDFATAELFLKSVPQVPAYAEFRASQQAKLLWGKSRRTEAETLAKAFTGVWSREVSLTVSQWMCFRSTMSQCSSFEIPSCKTFKKIVSEAKTVVANDKVAVLAIREAACKGTNSWAQFQAQNQDLSFAAREYIDSYHSFKSANRSIGLAKLKKVFANSDSEIFRLESARVLLSDSKSSGDVLQIFNVWKSESANENWAMIGLQILQAFYNHSDYSMVSQVAERLNSEGFVLGLPQKKIQILSLYQSGHEKKAWDYYLAEFDESSGLENRSPASLNEFENTLRLLQRKYRGRQ